MGQSFRPNKMIPTILTCSYMFSLKWPWVADQKIQKPWPIWGPMLTLTQEVGHEDGVHGHGQLFLRSAGDQLWSAVISWGFKSKKLHLNQTESVWIGRNHWFHWWSRAGMVENPLHRWGPGQPGYKMQQDAARTLMASSELEALLCTCGGVLQRGFPCLKGWVSVAIAPFLRKSSEPVSSISQVASAQPKNQSESGKALPFWMSHKTSVILYSSGKLICAQRSPGHLSILILFCIL